MEGKTILEEAHDDVQRKVAKEVVISCSFEDRDIYELAKKLVTKLGLSGFWIGYDLALLYAIKALKEAQAMVKKGE